MTRTNLVTGGAGFIGTNLADRLLEQGERVVVLDDLSRAGVEENLRWLVAKHSDRLRVLEGDVRDPAAVRSAARDADRVFHLAGQVAVTTSVSDPARDFEVNLLGTLTVLEELRRRAEPTPLLFTSTNKVYGELRGIDLVRAGERWVPLDPDVHEHGVSEDRPLQFASPYGCSKGGADQYVLDYAESYGIPTTVFRMSCIYGRHQCGNEDQGWVAHFLLQALAGRPITLYGDGRQVRDVLWVDDLLDAMGLAMDQVHEHPGRAYNIGGGADNSISLLELLGLLGELGARPRVDFGDWRIGDQRYYVSDTRRFQQATGWAPQVSPREGVGLLHDWFARTRVA